MTSGDVTHGRVLPGAAQRELQETAARCIATQARAKAALNRAMAVLAVAEERLRRAEATQTAANDTWQRMRSLRNQFRGADDHLSATTDAGRAAR